MADPVITRREALASSLILAGIAVMPVVAAPSEPFTLAYAEWQRASAAVASCPLTSCDESEKAFGWLVEAELDARDKLARTPPPDLAGFRLKYRALMGDSDALHLAVDTDWPDLLAHDLDRLVRALAARKSGGRSSAGRACTRSAASDGSGRWIAPVFERDSGAGQTLPCRFAGRC